METDRLLENLRELYDVALEYEFHKSSYEKYMESLKSKYADLLEETERRTGWNALPPVFRNMSAVNWTRLVQKGSGIWRR